ncbi:glycoside hydrolase superfamily [Mycena leptocephala]|nr:glycoside hydrolase superfamily [Mycena leptocephala]
MKLALFLAALIPSTLAANSFSGANNYFIYALPTADRIAILDGMQAVGMKVLRTWVNGFTTGQKAGKNIAVQDLEADGIGKYDDTVLDLIDQLMVEAHARGIKLLIGMHSHNALQTGDIYKSIFGVEGFYTNPSAPMLFSQSFYLEHLSWICNAAEQIRNNTGDRNQLIFTGGGAAAASIQPTFFGSSCKAIDVVAVHDYTECVVITLLPEYDSYLPSAISQAQGAGKKLIVEEWGSLVGSGRTANLNSNVQKINSHKVPWLYWELISNPDPHHDEDYEIEVNGPDWSTISSAAKATAAITDAPFDFSASLVLQWGLAPRVEL